MRVEGPESWNGGRIERRPGAPIGLIAFATLAFAFAGIGATTGNLNWAVAAIFPGTLAVMLFVFRERRYVATFTETEMIVGDPPQSTIPFATIDRLWADGRHVEPGNRNRKPFPFHVQHAKGSVRVPPLKSPSSYEVYCYLESFIPVEAGGEVHPDLADFYQRQVALHGREAVWVFRAAKSRRLARPSRRRLRAFSAALLIAGVAWIVIGATARSFAESVWGPIGISFAFLGAIFLLVSFADLLEHPSLAIKKWRQSCLILSPRGLAMVQADVAGEMGWHEVVDLAYRPRPDLVNSSFRLSSRSVVGGILLKVKGANIIIPEIYDRPLFVIYDRMLEAIERRGQAAASRRAPKTVLDDLEIVDDPPEH